MAKFRRSSIPRGSRPVRPMDWIHRADSPGGVNPGASVCFWVLSPDRAMNEFTDPTLMRSIVNIAVRNRTAISALQPATGGNLVHFGAGLIRWQGLPEQRSVQDDEPNTVAGTASTPNPCPDVFLEGEQDWIWRWVVVAAPTVPAGSPSSVPDIETASSKAKRRLGSGNGLLLVLSNQTSSIMDVSYDVRCLIKE